MADDEICGACGVPLYKHADTCWASDILAQDKINSTLRIGANHPLGKIAWIDKAYFEELDKVLGRKDDADKTDWSLMPWKELEDVAKVLTYGAKKYAPDNWKHVENHRDRYFSAAMRHVLAWREGELADPETGLPHLAHAVCCLLFLMGREGE